MPFEKEFSDVCFDSDYLGSGRQRYIFRTCEWKRIICAITPSQWLGRIFLNYYLVFATALWTCTAYHSWDLFHRQ